MKPALFLACGVIFILGTAAAEDVVRFPRRKINVAEVIRLVEAQTGRTVSLPFAEGTPTSQEFPESMTVEEVAGWICRHYKTRLGLRLRPFLQKQALVFQKASALGEEAQKSILAQNVVLKGQGIGIVAALTQAARQSNLDISFLVEDKAALEADYDYTCTLGEFLEEVAEYMRRYNRRDVDYALTDDAVTLFDLGPAPARPLKVEIVREAAPATSALIPEPAPSKLPPYPAPAEDRLTMALGLERAQKESLLLYADPARHHELYVALNTPRERRLRMADLLDDLRPFLVERRGRAEWEARLKDLDAIPASAYEKAAVMGRIIAPWNAELEKRIAAQPLRAPTAAWTLSTRFGFIMGKNWARIGTSPITPLRSRVQGHGLEAAVGVGYDVVHGPWSTRVDLRVDSTRSIKDLEELEQGAFELEARTNRLVGRGGLLSMTPHAAVRHESDYFGATSLQDHEIYLGGLALHWEEKKDAIRDFALTADSDLFAGAVRPKGEERHDFLALQDRSSHFFGFSHRAGLVERRGDYIHGFYAEIGLSRYLSKSPHENGREDFVEAGYRYERKVWEYAAHYRPSWVHRAYATRRMGHLQVSAAARPFGRPERWYLAGDCEVARAGLDYENYSSRGFRLGVERTW